MCNIWFSTQDWNILENCDLLHMKAGIHSFVLSTEQFLSYIREMRYLPPKFAFKKCIVVRKPFVFCMHNPQIKLKWFIFKKWSFISSSNMFSEVIYKPSNFQITKDWEWAPSSLLIRGAVQCWDTRDMFMYPNIS